MSDYLDDVIEARKKRFEEQRKKAEEKELNDAKVLGMTVEEYRQKKEEQKFEYFDSLYTMENGTATFFYIITMVIGAIFVDRWFIWIAATFIYILFMFRHKINKNK